ncbi:SDR family NAD(P)-dependent oxidoreductase [Halarchaeum nitratireducens]|uniref:3-oxoacyl-ACP reductase n=1 Tax=Halarchaeum nitratireducens TaxID=489913 RepID=A0A830GCI1_9EURY|nr:MULTISPECIES: 3-oxoacyl-ACP reductase family protein [Halarchaeum]MBP2252451.1 3-oxoacyl-[acyl-carrier protein] reductase [Halarchaeum solikamskense]GGN21097.1 3-oxoacyl-ACP reductase [Halarchaeum nitratireducens]
MFRLDDTLALVTGASSGIGAGIARALAEAGATVAVNHPPTPDERERADAVVADIEANGGDAVALAADVGDEASVRAMVDDIESAYGTPDALINNAGILTQSPLAEMPVEMWDETMAVDLRGVFLTTRFVLPGMLERGSGTIVNVASQLGIKGGAELVHYSAAKAGVIGMTRALAREVSPTVTVNAIAPGPVETPLLGDISEEWQSDKAAEIPMRRFGRVEDVAPTAVFLASDAGAYYTGQTLSPDGGDAMH